MGIGQYVKSADWKNEKHVPAIDCTDNFQPDAAEEVVVTVGKEIAHPNTLEHHIRWVALSFVGANGIVTELGIAEFLAHSEGGALTSSKATFTVKLSGPGTLIATSYCNIHGLWESSKEVAVG